MEVREAARVGSLREGGGAGRRKAEGTEREVGEEAIAILLLRLDWLYHLFIYSWDLYLKQL
jgi:hypothetical protein